MPEKLLEQILHKLDHIESHINAIKQDIQALDTRVERLERKRSKVPAQMERLDKYVAIMEQEIRSVRGEQQRQGELLQLVADTAGAAAKQLADMQVKQGQLASSLLALHQQMHESRERDQRSDDVLDALFMRSLEQEVHLREWKAYFGHMKAAGP
ncbi:hypothetical protein [Paenibacillus hamazuiensis]|uniref:hypothetical protein n=1 Tax=Paenibacillus hamazuiensis TaxID=2936508 RepID=UPI00200D6AAC|nr:hypothetical protein [Paenibacillus hamazuiensis]